MRRLGQVVAAVLLLAAAGAAQVPISDVLQQGATANGAGRNLPVQGYATVALTVNCASCSGGTQVNFELTQDGVNWVAATAVASTGGTATSTTTAGVTVWTVQAAGYLAFRTRVSAYSAGTVTTSATAVMNSSVGTGVVAKADASAQAANLSATTIYSVPAGGAGMYRLSCYIVITQAATTSATLPGCSAYWTDNDTGTTANTSGVALSSSTSANSVGNNSSQVNPAESIIIAAKAGTNIQIATSGYASTGATPMQFGIHVKLEFLGQ
jgi:hypothetical protein